MKNTRTMKSKAWPASEKKQNFWDTAMSKARLSKTYEAKELNLARLSQLRFNKPWHECTGTQRVQIIRDNLTGVSGIINPNSTWMGWWSGCVVAALIFTCIVTPFEVALLETKFDILFGANLVVNFVYLVDIVIIFSTKIKVETRTQAKWVSSRKEIARKYVKSWFFLDLVSTLPFDLLSIAGDKASAQAYSRFKMLRFIRLLKLIKLVRVLKSSNNFEYILNQLTINCGMASLYKMLVGLFCLAHWEACMWALIGLTGSSRLICTETERELTQFYHIPGDPYWWYGGGKGPHENDGTSWVSQLYLHSGKVSGDSPCSVWDLYSVSLHWSIMTITSIGYGDVSPVKQSEYWFSCIAMLISSGCWAYIIGTCCGIVSQLDPYQQKYELGLDALNFMLKDREVPFALQIKLRRFFRESKHLQRVVQYKDINANMSECLRGEVALHSSANSLFKVWFLRYSSKPFIVQIAQALKPELLGIREEFPRAVRRMNIVERGICIRGGMVFTAGQSFGGEEILLSSTYLMKDVSAISMTYVEVNFLTRSDLKNILEDFPLERKRLRKCTVKLAAIRGIIIAALYYRKTRKLRRQSCLHSRRCEKAREERGESIAVWSREMSMPDHRASKLGAAPAASTETAQRSLSLAASKEGPDAAAAPTETVQRSLSLAATAIKEVAAVPRGGATPDGNDNNLHVMGKMMETLEARLAKMFEDHSSKVVAQVIETMQKNEVLTGEDSSVVEKESSIE